MAKAKKTAGKIQFTKYEQARILGSRALQVSMGAPYLIKISKKRLEELKYNPLEIAKLEFEAGVIPITVIRPLPQIEEKEAK
jgi:DNA-directed RNA polymerase subunit K/omega